VTSFATRRLARSLAALGTFGAFNTVTALARIGARLFTTSLRDGAMRS
jgi:hypothetical protein